MANNPRPGIHIVTFNSASAITKCLESLRKYAPGSEIVVVDNGSVDGSADVVADLAAQMAASAAGGTVRVSSALPTIQLIRNAENRGFAAAANQAVEASAGRSMTAASASAAEPEGSEAAAGPSESGATGSDPVIFLNPDTEVCEGWLEAICGALQAPDVGVAGCKVLEPDGKTLQHMGGRLRANGLTEHIGRGEIDQGQYDEVRVVDYVTGAALGIRRHIWDKLGGFDQGYFPAYFEELELCWRARARGYRVIVVPAARVLHAEASSSKEPGLVGAVGARRASPSARVPSAAFYRAYHRNRARFVLRNYRTIDLIFRFIPAELSWLVRAKPRRQLGAAAAAYLQGLVGLPQTMAWRWRGR